MLGERVDVVGEGERHHVGFEPVDHRAGLFARAAVRLVDGDEFVVLLLPLRRECGVHFLVQLAGRVVRNIEQSELARVRADRHGAGQHDRKHCSPHDRPPRSPFPGSERSERIVTADITERRIDILRHGRALQRRNRPLQGRARRGAQRAESARHCGASAH